MSTLASFGVILLCGIVLGSLLKAIRLPSLLAYLLVGIILGPYILNILSPGFLALSGDVRQLALIIILLRAGLSLRLSSFKEMGRSALLLCFLPASFEIAAYVLLSPLFLGFSFQEGALLGAVMAAVSPAVVVPRMLRLQKEGYGSKKAIPEMVVAGSSCDDVFVIVLFGAFLTMVSSGDFDFNIFWKIPVSILLGILVGALFGLAFYFAFKKIKVRDTFKILLLLAFSCLFVYLENLLKPYVPYSGLLSVITMGILFRFKAEEKAKQLSLRYEKLWVFAEIFLFSYVGIEVNIGYALKAFLPSLGLILSALAVRSIGVLACLIKTKLTFRERLFVVLSYLPKATVQAAIGGIALSNGLPCGEAILSCAVIGILITAPLGAFLIDIFSKKLLKKEATVETASRSEILEIQEEKTKLMDESRKL